MTIRTYYRAALLLPLALPALLSVTLFWDAKPPLLSGILFYLFGSLLIGGIPYTLFVFGFLIWSGGRTDRELRRAVLLAPLVYSAVLVACYVVFMAMNGRLAENGDGIGVMVGCGVMFGYAYVILAELGRLLLRPRGEMPLATA